MSAPNPLWFDGGGCGPAAVHAVATHLNTLCGPDYQYGWNRPNSLPVRPDSTEYAISTVLPAMRVAVELRKTTPENVPSPSVGLDNAGVIVIVFARTPLNQPERYVRVDIPCRGVVRWAKQSNAGSDVSSEGVCVDYTTEELESLFADLFSWLSKRFMAERNPMDFRRPKR